MEEEAKDKPHKPDEEQKGNISEIINRMSLSAPEEGDEVIDVNELGNTLKSALAEIKVLRYGMEKDQTEIDRLKVETRAILDKLLAA